MEIYQKPTFLPVTVDYYQMVSYKNTLLGSYDNFAIYAMAGKLESDLVGVFFNVFVAQSSINFAPKLGDYVVINSQAYTVTKAPLYQKGNSNIAPFYKLTVKTAVLP